MVETLVHVLGFCWKRGVGMLTPFIVIDLFSVCGSPVSPQFETKALLFSWLTRFFFPFLGFSCDLT